MGIAQRRDGVRGSIDQFLAVVALQQCRQLRDTVEIVGQASDGRRTNRNGGPGGGVGVVQLARCWRIDEVTERKVTFASGREWSSMRKRLLALPSSSGAQMAAARLRSGSTGAGT